MKNQRKTNIKVGVTVLVSLFIVIWIIGWAKNFSLQDNFNDLRISFNSVSGLNTNDIVTVSGVKKGYVNAISLEGNRSIVSIKLERDVKLTKGTKYYIMMLDLMGGKKVEIIPSANTDLIDYSETQIGEFSGDVSTAMAFVGTLQTDVRILFDKLNLTLDNLNNSLINKSFTKKADNLLSNANALLNELNFTLKENQAGIKSLIEVGNSALSNANTFFENNEEKIDSLLLNINITVNKSNEILTKFNELMNETTEKKNNIGKLLYDEKLINDLKESIFSVKNLTKILVEQLNSKGIKVDAYIF